MILTHENLHSIGKSGCGFNSAQLTLLGVTSARKGWLSSLIGKEVSEETWETLLKLKGATVTAQRALVPERLPIWASSNSKPLFRKSECKKQWRRFWNCIAAGEYLAAEDHVNRIAQLCREANPPSARE